MTSTSTTSSTCGGCSFCGKPRAEVDKLFAGPGVKICDGCVQLLHDIMDGPIPEPIGIPRKTAALEMPPDQYLGGLANHARALQQVERDIRTWVQRGIDQGIAWAQIAEALALSEDEARRFSTTP